MKYRLLGQNTGLAVSELVLGTARMGKSASGQSNANEARMILQHFHAAGGNFIDTSSAYQGGQSETFLGDFLAGHRRDEFVIASKYCRTAEATPAIATHGNHRKSLKIEVEGSLKRLKTDYIDVYLVHFDDGITPIDEILRGLDDLVRAGKILYVGLSNMPVWRVASAFMLAKSAGLTPPSVMQMQYNLAERAIEREYLPFAFASGMAMMAWSPLFGGVLAKDVADLGDVAGAGSGQSNPDNRANTHLVPALEKLAEMAGRLHKSRAEIALAWLLAKGTFPVLGPRTLDQLNGCLLAGEVVLSDDDLASLDQAFVFQAGYPYDLLDETCQATGYRHLARNGPVL
ncbi:aldo/keto reductase [Thalassospira marina]|uniref:Oxidoreductase n=1 Tax=Thalassospira marina TaxID=2048283 RepID=A0A2N3KVV3_9PROT|nr:aldo/keto reductase [Thalassospira marina]PKR54695.1 oxidoreductase [Thalassospira marina]